MAKISVGMSFTINNFTKAIDYAKIDARVDDLDLEQDIDSQLANFDDAIENTYTKLKTSLKDKIK